MNESKSSFQKIKSRRQVALALIGVGIACVVVYAAFFAVDPEEREVNRLTGQIESLRGQNMAIIDETRKEFGIHEPGLSPAGGPVGPSPVAGLQLSPEEREQLMARYREKSRETREQMRAIREEIDKLKPETRKKVVNSLMKSELDQARKRYANLSDEEKRGIVNQMVEQVRDRFDRISPEEREKRKDEMNTPEAKERAKEAMNFYMEELSAKEREMLDPLVREMIISLERL